MKATKLKFLLLVVALASCQDSKKPVKSEEITQAERDSFAIAKYGKKADEVIKDRVQESMKNGFIDTNGLYKSPVKVLSAKLTKKEYSSYRDIRLTFKNVSKKTIYGIKFAWYGENAFKEPADMGSTIIEGTGGGFTDQTLKPGRSLTLTWDISSRDAKKVILAWPTEVAFSDGTSWKLR